MKPKSDSYLIFLVWQSLVLLEEGEGSQIKKIIIKCFSSVQFSCSVVSDSLRPHEPQHARPPCPSPSPGVHSDSRPSSQWCHPTISSSVIPFSSCPQSFPESGSFPVSQLLASGGQSTMNIQNKFPLEWTSLISLLSKDSQEYSPTPQFKKHQYFSAQLSL